MQIAKGETSAPREERDDAMFAKKPLQGWSCASCDKNIVNLQGMPADYYNWKKLPQSKDRIPMVRKSQLTKLYRWDKVSRGCYNRLVTSIQVR